MNDKMFPNIGIPRNDILEEFRISTKLLYSILRKHNVKLDVYKRQGWKPLVDFIYKGEQEMYEVTLEDGILTVAIRTDL